MNDELQREIDAYLQTHWEEVVADIDALVQVDSVEDLEAAAENAPYGPGPREALDRALGIAERMGLAVRDCEGRIGYADLEGDSKTQIGIIGHVDVVPAGPGWNFEPHAVTQKDGYLIGRGVLDDKGPLVVALHAVRFWRDRYASQGAKPPYTVRVLFGANEETNMKDVEYYRARNDDPAFLFTPDSQFPLGYGESGICSGVLTSAPIESGHIVELQGGQAVNAVPGHARSVVRSSRALYGAGPVSVEDVGQGRYLVEAHGVSAHAMEPEAGCNAIGLLVDFLVERGVGTPEEQAFMEALQALHGHHDGSGFGVECSDEHFGALSVVGGMAWLEDGRLCQSMDFRYPTTTTASEIEQAVRASVKRIAPDMEFSLQHDKQPFLMNPDSPAVRALLKAYCDVTGEDARGLTSKGGTYARCFTAGVSFGVEKPWVSDPDWVGSMHGPDEGVGIQRLQEAFCIYARALGNLMQVDLA